MEGRSARMDVKLSMDETDEDMVEDEVSISWHYE